MSGKHAGLLTLLLRFGDMEGKYKYISSRAIKVYQHLYGLALQAGFYADEVECLSVRRPRFDPEQGHG